MRRICILNFLIAFIGTVFLAVPAECRMYDPKIGRFLQRDPIGYVDSMNLFTYVSNNPINATDPFGLMEILRVPKTPMNYPKPPGWTSEWVWRFPSKTSSKATPRWFDPKGGEWRWHAPDRFHPKGHWDYNPWDQWNTKWQNVNPGIIPPFLQPNSNDSTDVCSEPQPPLHIEECFANGLCA